MRLQGYPIHKVALHGEGAIKHKDMMHFAGNAFCLFLVPSAVTSLLAYMPIQWQQLQADGPCHSIDDGCPFDDALPVEEEGTEEEECEDPDDAVSGDGSVGPDGADDANTDMLPLW